MNLATQLTSATWRTDALSDYRFKRTNRMLNDPKLVKQAITGECTWYGYTWSFVDEGGEDLEALEFAAHERLDAGGLSALEIADVHAALSAIDDFRQQRNARD